EIEQQYVLFPVWSSGSTNPQNNDGDVVLDEKKPKFDEKKPESEVNVSPSSSAQSKKLDDKTKREAKELEYITYSDDEDDVGAEADFNNLETSIIVSPIPTIRVHKDHPVTQIIGDLSLATQTRSMARVAKDQGFEDPDYPDKVYKVVKALYGLHQAPRSWHVVPAAVLTQSKHVPINVVPINVVRTVHTAIPNLKVTRPRHDKPIVTKPNSPTRRHINSSSYPKASNSPPRVTAVQAPMVNAAQGNPQHALKDKGVINSRCSTHMIGNMSYLSDFEELNGGYVAFGGNPKGGKISRKGKIRRGKFEFKDVYFVKELKFNLFSVSQMRDKKNIVLFTYTDCLVLSLEFKFPNASQVLLRVFRE
nr:ribonuclease H-like domain-containing protein [Tanacetum cinerariifolium]